MKNVRTDKFGSRALKINNAVPCDLNESTTSIIRPVYKLSETILTLGLTSKLSIYMLR